MSTSSQVSFKAVSSGGGFSFQIRDKSSEAQQLANEIQSLVAITFGTMTHEDSNRKSVRSVVITRQTNYISLGCPGGKPNPTAVAIFLHLKNTIPTDNPTITQIERACTSFQL
ncbi:MAG: hypothetical protein K1000chlam3_00893 [Chlamydiae bacterium]|nr:hypothetical protein [Chlamydiota bacterium]